MAGDTGKNLKKLRIGILTFHNADNYGAVLQCYALQETLRSLRPDDEVCVIDYRNPLIEKSYRVLGLRRSVLENISQILYVPSQLKKRRRFSSFRGEFLSVGSPDPNDCDVVFYGSDQIWNPELTGDDLAYFGANFRGTKIAYGASDGGEIKITEEVKKMLGDFNSISCREKSLSEKVSERLGKIVPTVCDPVFLLSKDEWLKIAVKPHEQNYILAYKISENIGFDDEVERTASRLGKPIVQIVYVRSLRKLICRTQKIKECLSPQQFVGLFASADFVLTTSFHGTAFSIIFEKPFFVLAFGSGSERITDLLNSLDLQGRYGRSVQNLSYDSLLLMEPPEKKLSEFQEESRSFMQTAMDFCR